MVVALVALRVALPFALEAAIPWVAESRAGARAEVDNIDLGLFAGTVLIEGLRVNHLEEEAGPEPEPEAEPAPDVEAATGPAAEPEPDVDAAEPAAEPEPDAVAADEPEAEPKSDAAAESEPEPDGSLLSLSRFSVDFEWLPLLAGRVHLRSLILERPSVALEENPDGSLKLPAPPAEPEPEPNAETATDEPAPADGEEEGAVPADEEADEGSGLEIVLDHFEVTDPLATLRTAAGVEVVRFGAHRFGLDAFSVGPEGIGLGGIAIEEPQIYVQREWMLRQGGGQQAAETRPAAAPPKVAVRQLDIQRATFTLQTDRGPLDVAVRLAVSQADTARGHVFPIDLGLEIGGGQVALQGKLGIDPLFYEGRFSWQNLGVPPFLLLSVPDLVPWLHSSRASGDFHVSFRADPASDLTGISIQGTSRVDELGFRQPESGELALEWDALEIEVADCYLPLEPTLESPGRAIFDRVTLTGPRFVFTNPPDALDELLALLGGQAPPEPDVEEPAPTPEVVADQPEEAATPPAEEPEPERIPVPVVEVRKLEIRDATLTYLDRTVTPHHETSIEKFRLDADQIVSAPVVGVGSLKAAGLIQKTGTLELTGKLPGGQGALEFDLEKLRIAPYDGFARSAGWRLMHGDTTLHSSIQVGADSYKSINKLVLHDLDVDTLEEGSFSSSFGISLDLALALLRDSQGNIKLSIPVDWRKGKLGVGTGSIIASALRGAVTGALTSPFKLVGSLVPGGGEEPSFEPIPMEAGSVEFAGEARKRIEPLANLLADRPELAVALGGTTGPDDRPILAETILREKAVAGNDFPDLDDAGFFARRRVTAALVERAAGQPGQLEPEDQSLLERYVEVQSVPEERSLELARLRAERLRDALIEEGAPPESITLEQPHASEQAGVEFELRPRGEPADEQTEPAQ